MADAVVEHVVPLDPHFGDDVRQYTRLEGCAPGGESSVDWHKVLSSSDTSDSRLPVN